MLKGAKDSARHRARDLPVHGTAVPHGSVVGHAEPSPSSRAGAGPQGRARALHELGEALRVDPTGLTGLSDTQAAAALRQVRGLIARAAALEALVTIDDLTGVLRRGPGMSALTEEIHRARRLEICLAVAFIDVDGLKAVNDVEGHAAGDAVLRTVAVTLRSGLRSYDVVMRYGGDEFVCVLFGAELDGAERLLKDIGDAVAAGTGGVGVSVGLAGLEAGDDADSLLRRADADLIAGRSGRRARPRIAASQVRLGASW